MGGQAPSLEEIQAQIPRLMEASRSFWDVWYRRFETLHLENEVLRAEVRFLKSRPHFESEKRSVAEEAIYGVAATERANYFSHGEESLKVKLAVAEDKVAAVVLAMREIGLPVGTTTDQFAFWLMDRVAEMKRGA